MRDASCTLARALYRRDFRMAPESRSARDHEAPSCERARHHRRRRDDRNGGLGSSKPKIAAKGVLDRPFLFAIVDQTTRPYSSRTVGDPTKR